MFGTSSFIASRITMRHSKRIFFSCGDSVVLIRPSLSHDAVPLCLPQKTSFRPTYAVHAPLMHETYSVMVACDFQGSWLLKQSFASTFLGTTRHWTTSWINLDHLSDVHAAGASYLLNLPLSFITFADDLISDMPWISKESDQPMTFIRIVY